MPAETQTNLQILLCFWGLHKEDRGHGPKATFTTGEHRTWIRCNQCGWKHTMSPQQIREQRDILGHTHDQQIAKNTDEVS